MSQRTATITSLPMAFEVVKAMQADGLDWGDGYRPLGRQALEEIIEGQMAAAVDPLQSADARRRRALPQDRRRALRRPVLVALGLRHDGKKEIIDFRLAASESAAEWEKFLADLYRRGLSGEGLDMICVDGGGGLLAALPGIFHGIPVQRCWAHKIRNILDKVKKADQPAVKRALHKIMNASNAPAARAAARKFANRFEDKYSAAVACLRNDLDELLTCFRYKSEDQRRKVRTTNAIERRFREVRRRTRPMGTFQDRTSMDRILFAVFTHENKSQGVSTPFLLTQNN